MYQDIGYTAVARASRVLVLEDGRAAKPTIVTILNNAALRASVVTGRRALIHALSVREPDLIIIDLDVDEEDGLDILRELRGRSIVPVILITALRCDEVDRVVGLEMGADDYLSRPIGSHELLARIRAALRRRTMDSANPLKRTELRYTFNGWILDQRSRELLSPAGKRIALTKNEYALLSALVAAPRRALTREHLLQATRVHEDVYDRSIDVQVLRLRRKLEDDAASPRLIRTQRGVGYVLDADVTIL